MSYGILTHVIRQTGLTPEPTATLSLAHLLRSSTTVSTQLLHRLGVPRFTPGLIVAERNHNGRIPDLTIEDSDGHIRLLIENKFSTSLTSQQPVGYLRLLPTGTPSTLLFIVPHPLMDEMWETLRTRCKESNLTLDVTQQDENNVSAFIRDTDHVLHLTHWRYVLALLSQLASSLEMTDLLSDIHQLQDFANFDSEIPVEYDVERFIQIGAQIRDAAISDVQRITRGKNGRGRPWRTYVNVLDPNTGTRHFRVSIGVSSKARQTQDDSGSPLHVNLWNTPWGGLTHRWGQICEAFTDTIPIHRGLLIPLQLIGDDEDSQVQNGVRQIVEIINTVEQLAPAA